MQNQGYVDIHKNPDCIRILSLNPSEFGPDNAEKMELMMRAARTNKIDGILLSSPDRKWTTSRIEQIKRKFKKVNKEIIVIALDSG